MFNKIASAPKKVANHIVSHRAAYGFTAGVITGGVIMRQLDSSTYGAALAFLEEKGLTDEFFLAPEDL
jgi:hypothetical protein